MISPEEISKTESTEEDATSVLDYSCTSEIGLLLAKQIEEYRTTNQRVVYFKSQTGSVTPVVSLKRFRDSPDR